MRYPKVEHAGPYCGYCHSDVDDVIEHRKTCADRATYMRKQQEKVSGNISKHAPAGLIDAKKGRFVFMPVKKMGREAIAPMSVAITRHGMLYVGNSTFERLGLSESGVVVQLVADYDRRAIGFKLLKNIKMGDENTIQDSSVRFLKPTNNKGSFCINIMMKKILDSLNYDYKTAVSHFELSQYNDQWAKDVYYITVPSKNPVIKINGHTEQTDVSSSQ